MPAQRKYPDALRERAVKMVFGDPGPGGQEPRFAGLAYGLVRGVRPEALRGRVKQAETSTSSRSPARQPAQFLGLRTR